MTMQITRLKLKNWRNFREIDFALGEVTYVIGPNAVGKSNLLDAFRFLRDVCASGGGLQAAVSARRGMKKLRCLHARNDTEVRIEVELEEGGPPLMKWRYVLGFKGFSGKEVAVRIHTEQVFRDGTKILTRPGKGDNDDPLRLSQTHLEQIQANQAFRQISDAFRSVTYLHLVPQLLRHAEEIGGNRLQADPFGQGLLERIAKTSETTRNARLRKIESALRVAVPKFSDLQFEKDAMGHPHLKALYEHHRPQGAWQTEEQFSDGTLRLVGLLWSLLADEGLLLLEEPEISLNGDVVKQIPLMVSRANRQRKVKRQILISTHSAELLGNQGIDERYVVRLEPDQEGSRIAPQTDIERKAIQAGLSVAEVLLPRAAPKSVGQLHLWT